MVMRAMQQDGTYTHTRNESDHVHPPNKTHAFARETFAIAREEAVRNLGVPTAEVRNGAVRRAFPEEDRRAYVPRLYRVDRVIQDERRRARPAEPETVQSPLAMDWLALKCPALQVLLDHPGVDGSRVTAFSTLFHLSQLAAMQTWFVDGTFKTRPAIYRNKASQVYTIHGFVGGPNGMKQFPMVFVLMTNRRTEDYVHLFEGVKRAM